METVSLDHVAELLESLRQELARLSDRVAALEGVAAPVTPANPPVPAAEPLSDEIVLVLGAAVAAFLGKKAHIRQIRLLGSAAWLHQGRVTIQASHLR